MGIAVGSVALVAQLPGWAAWILGVFTATTFYLVGAIRQLAICADRQELARPASGRV